jgi:hypothetical protein
VQESTLLKDPVLKAAMTRVSPTAERFHFAGELVAVAAPPGLALSDSSALLGTPMQVTPNSAAGAPATATSASSDAKSAVADAPSISAPVPSKATSQQLTPSSPKETSGIVDSLKKSMNQQNPTPAQSGGTKAYDAVPIIPQPEKKS